MTQGWVVWALLSAVFAALTAIFAKVGLAGTDADVVTLLRATLVALMIGVFIAASGKLRASWILPGRTWLFLVLCSAAAAASWICYFRALQSGSVATVAAIDKSSLLLTAVLAFALLGERPHARDWAGIALIAGGVTLMVLKR